MEVDDFHTKTSLFLSWLSNMGVSMSPKIALVDLGSSGRGRAVGEFLIQVLAGNIWAVLLECPFLLFGVIYLSCQVHHEPKM